MAFLLERLRRSYDYHRLASDPIQDEEKVAAPSRVCSRRRSIWSAVIVLSLGVLGLVLRSSMGYPSSRLNSAGQCQQPAIRREWRSFSDTEKQAYIDAVQCLRQSPSQLGLNHSLYDDFPWVHSQVGGYCQYIPAIPKLIPNLT